jgi:hypothetical protein
MGRTAQSVSSNDLASWTHVDVLRLTRETVIRDELVGDDFDADQLADL